MLGCVTLLPSNLKETQFHEYMCKTEQNVLNFTQSYSVLKGLHSGLEQTMQLTNSGMESNCATPPHVPDGPKQTAMLFYVHMWVQHYTW